jgi:hypothetical protein
MNTFSTICLYEAEKESVFILNKVFKFEERTRNSFILTEYL